MSDIYVRHDSYLDFFFSLIKEAGFVNLISSLNVNKLQVYYIYGYV